MKNYSHYNVYGNDVVFFIIINLQIKRGERQCHLSIKAFIGLHSTDHMKSDRRKYKKRALERNKSSYLNDHLEV